MTSLPELNPDRDGIDHINIYSKSATWLGREASNFAGWRMQVPDHGTFNSIEGYWYWLLSGDESLRSLTGVDAKTAGRKALKSSQKTRPDDFENRIRIAIREKVNQHQGLKRALADSTLPFTHYYIMTDRKSGTRKVIDANNQPWVLHEWECIRADLRGEPKPEAPRQTHTPSESGKDDQYDLF